MRKCELEVEWPKDKFLRINLHSNCYNFPIIKSFIYSNFHLHRHCWRKHRRQSAMGNDMISDKSTDPLAEKNHDEVSHKVLK